MATVSMVSEKTPRVGLWPRLEPFEFGILHWQDKGVTSKLTAAVSFFFKINAHFITLAPIVFEEVCAAC